MELEPRHLAVPLHPRQWFWLKARVVIALAALALLLVLPGFGVPFASAMLAAAPVLVPYVVSIRVQRATRAGGLVLRVAALAGVLLYLGFAKQVVVPWLATWLRSVIA